MIFVVEKINNYAVGVIIYFLFEKIKINYILLYDNI